MFVYPHITNYKDICITPEDHYQYKLIKPGESVQIPFSINYNYSDENDKELKFVEKTISFDIRASLYSDPVNYKFTLRAYNNDTIDTQLLKKLKKTKYNPVVIN